MNARKQKTRLQFLEKYMPLKQLNFQKQFMAGAF